MREASGAVVDSARALQEFSRRIRPAQGLRGGQIMPALQATLHPTRTALCVKGAFTGARAHAVTDEATGGTEYVGAVMDVTAARESRLSLEKAYAEIQRLKDQLQRENIVLRVEIDKTSMFAEIVGTSPPLRNGLSPGPQGA